MEIIDEFKHVLIRKTVFTEEALALSTQQLLVLSGAAGAALSSIAIGCLLLGGEAYTAVSSDPCLNVSPMYLLFYIQPLISCSVQNSTDKIRITRYGNEDWKAR